MHPVPMPIPGKPGDYPYEWSYLNAAHEIGSTLGLGQARPIVTSVGLMGCGAFSIGDPFFTISACDVAALNVV